MRLAEVSAVPHPSGSAILTVTEVTEQVKALLEERWPSVWVTGEISNFRVPSSGHWYFTLKDDRSQLRVVIFRSAARAVPFTPADGLETIVHGTLTVYEARGEYQLVADAMEPKGIGALQLAFEQLKARLEAEGLFAAERKKPLPLLPQRVGIVTSPTGAALRDILAILRRRFDGLAVLIVPVRVQGAEAPGEIMEALRGLHARADVDVIVLARGGGSIEDLWAFNDEGVARAIAASAIPVISAIGHETDVTIADFVADVRAPTPSGAALLVVRSKQEFVDRVASLARRVLEEMTYLVNVRRMDLEQLVARLTGPGRDIRESAQRLDDLAARLHAHLQHQVARKGAAVDARLRRLLVASPAVAVQRAGRRLRDAATRLTFHLDRHLRDARARALNAAQRLHDLSPLQVLSRGYSITYLLPLRLVTTRADQLTGGDLVEIQFAKGTATCTVERAKP